MQERLGRARVEGYLAHKKLRPPLGSPQGPGHSPTVGSWEEGISYEQATPVPFLCPTSLYSTTPPEATGGYPHEAGIGLCLIVGFKVASRICGGFNRGENS